MTVLPIGKIAQAVEDIAVIVDLAILWIGQSYLVASPVFPLHIKPSIPSQQDVRNKEG